MPKFLVQLTRVDTFSITVEADDEDSARDLAYEETPGICAQDCGWGHKWSVDPGEWEDDEVNEIKS